MHIVTIQNGTESVIIHDNQPSSLQKLASGSFTDEINVVPTGNFAIYPQNAGYDKLHPLTTLISVYDTVHEKYIFEGRLLKPTGSMKKSGQIATKWSCEGFMAYLQDSVQTYQPYENTDVPDFLQALLDKHNALVEPEKYIYLGQCDIHDTSHKTTAYRRTLEEIRENLIARLGGELRVYKSGGKLYLDYVTQYGHRSDTKIQLERNLQELEVTTDPTNIITRLIPLGCKRNEETAERLTIESVNDGCVYLDDAQAIQEHGIQCAVYEWDDVTLPEHLKQKGLEYLRQNHHIKKHFKITALDLSIIGLDTESFTVGDSYKTENSLMQIDDWLRVIKRTTDICEPQKSNMEIGEKRETISQMTNRSYSYVVYEMPKQRNEILQSAKNQASAMITQATKGYILIDNEHGELLITDAPIKEDAVKIWRFNSSGLGYSSTGYSGEYGIAILKDGGIIADRITSGIITGIEFNNGNGKFHVTSDGKVTASEIEISNGTDENNQPVFYVDTNGNVSASSISITGGSINILTNSENYDVISLRYQNYRFYASPSAVKMEHDTLNANMGLGCTGLTFTKNDILHISVNGLTGTITAAGNITSKNNLIAEGSVSAPEGKFDKVVYKAENGNYYSLTTALYTATVTAETGNFDTVTSGTGKFDTLTYMRNGTYYSLENSINTMQNNIDTLWTAVFG